MTRDEHNAVLREIAGELRERYGTSMDESRERGMGPTARGVCIGEASAYQSAAELVERRIKETP